MRIINILHHSISPFAGQYPESDPLHYNSGFPMKYARAIRVRHPDAELECWRPERTARNVYDWHDDDNRIAHRVFPSVYGRWNLEYSRPMAQAVRKEVARGDAWFILHGNYNLHAYTLASMLSPAPAILQSHGGFPATELYRRSRHRWLRSIFLTYAPIERSTLPKYRHIFAISTEERAYLTKLCPNSTVHFSPTGIDFDLFSPGEQSSARAACGLAAGDRILLYVGRLSAEKGLTYLLDAMPSAVKAFGAGIRLIIIGSGPLRDALIAQAQHLKITQSVQFLGSVSNEELPQWYRAADVTVMPSLLEWFGAVAVESMACGTPIIGTAAGGLVDIVSEFQSGVLVPPRSTQALAEALLEALSGHPLPAPNIERGRAAFDWSVKIARMMDIWSGMTGKSRSP